MKTLQPDDTEEPLPEAPAGPIDDCTPDSRARQPLVDDPAFYRDVLVIASWWLSQDKPNEAKDAIQFALRGDMPEQPPEEEFDSDQVTLFQGDDV